MTTEENIGRASRAASIVNDPIYVEAMASMKQEILDKWGASAATDAAGREWLWRHYQVALKFEEAFKTIMNTGKLAEETLRYKQRDGLIDRAVRYWNRDQNAA